MYFSEEKRERNKKRIADLFEDVDMDFNSAVFAFNDLVQSIFLNSAMMGVGQDDKDEVHKKATDLANDLVAVLNKHKHSAIIDMIALTNVVMECVESAMVRAIKDQESKSKTT